MTAYFQELQYVGFPFEKSTHILLLTIGNGEVDDDEDDKVANDDEDTDY